ncbi:Sec-independent protein translocase subunit TatA [Actinomycetospora sp.]|jgi:sec-independent protein translocase protein TatA|uniref:Sec-independent protein translocase subunit TatA n=1 Tax=Actinomycetospora sp. TaxID=1872135 RepID=UPI002F406E43
MSEWIIVAVVGVILLFSAKKLPDMARGLGQSMRVFKAETRGLKEDDARSEQKPVEAAPTDTPTPSPAPAPARETVPDEVRRSE